MLRSEQAYESFHSPLDSGKGFRCHCGSLRISNYSAYVCLCCELRAVS